MSHPDQPPLPDSGKPAQGSHRAGGSRDAGKRNSHQLLALGSAAVLAIYAAGYFRTRAADEKFGAGTTGGRHPSPPAAENPSVSLTIDSAVGAPVVALVEPVAPTTVEMKSTPAPQTAVETTLPPATPAVEAAVVTKAPDLPTPSSAPITAPAPAVNPAVAAAAATAAPVVATVAPTPLPKWKDGKFSGWGYCRHGSIQATIEIKEGRIISAVISDCRTRYSCDVIAHVVPQVVARQSAEIDTVSGATQSADAFYGAISNALASAKPDPVKAL